MKRLTTHEDLLNTWARCWREETIPFHLKFGFSRGAAWIGQEHHHFIWEISHDGPETFTERNRHHRNSLGHAAVALGPGPPALHRDP